jgi:hypothetical protein
MLTPSLLKLAQLFAHRFLADQYLLVWAQFQLQVYSQHVAQDHLPGQRLQLMLAIQKKLFVGQTGRFI